MVCNDIELPLAELVAAQTVRPVVLAVIAVDCGVAVRKAVVVAKASALARRRASIAGRRVGPGCLSALIPVVV